VHEYYKEVARRAWEHAYLFRTVGVSTEQQARNRKEIDVILDTAFDTVLDSFLPWQSIVNTYFSVEDAPQKAEDVIQPTEIASAPAPPPTPVPASDEKKVAFEVEESEDEDDDVGTDDDDHPKLQLSDETAEIDLGIEEEAEKKKKEEENDDKDVKLEAKDGELVLKL
jgi:hypothetical protein